MSCSKSVESGLCLVFSGAPLPHEEAPTRSLQLRQEPGACDFVENHDWPKSSTVPFLFAVPIPITIRLRLLPCHPTSNILDFL
jgi:hypothetical protein